MSFWSELVSALFGTSSMIAIKGRITSYGYPGDSTPDSNSENAIGAWDNVLTDGVSLAVSPDIEAAFRETGIAPRASVVLQLDGGPEITVRWDDRTARAFEGKALTGRFDLYGRYKPSPFVDRVVTGFRKAV